MVTVTGIAPLSFETLFGLPPHVSEWRWACNFHGKPGDDSGSGVDLDDCKAKFRVAWSRIHAAPSDADIAKAHEMRR